MKSKKTKPAVKPTPSVGASAQPKRRAGLPGAIMTPIPKKKIEPQNDGGSKDGDEQQ